MEYGVYVKSKKYVKILGLEDDKYNIEFDNGVCLLVAKEEIIFKNCEYCGDIATNNNIEYYNLCDDCANKYYDKTGFCSLDCCISGRCDDSC